MTVVVHTDGNPLALASAARAELKALDPQLPAANMRTMDQVMSRASGSRRFNMALLAFFAVTALLLTSIGIHGVVAFLVRRRSREIGIRMALGARRSDVLWLVLRQGMTPDRRAVRVLAAGAPRHAGASAGSAAIRLNVIKTATRRQMRVSARSRGSRRGSIART